MKLPRITSSFAIVNAVGHALKNFSRMWDELCTTVEGSVDSDGSIAMQAPLTLKSYTVALLPAVTGSGKLAYVSNGRKAGEGPGAGTGVLVFSDATNWRACDTGATVAA